MMIMHCDNQCSYTYKFSVSDETSELGDQVVLMSEFGLHR